MFSANPFRNSHHYKVAIPFEQFKQKHPTLPPGQLGGHTVQNIQGQAMSAAVQAALPGAVAPRPVLQPPEPQPTNQWVQSIGPAPHPIAQPAIGRRLQPAPQPALTSAVAPGPVVQPPAPQPANQWVRYGGLAPQPIGQPVIGQRPQPAPAHHWVRANHR